MEQCTQFQIENHSPLAIVHMEGALAKLEVYKFKAQIEKLVQSGLRFLIFDFERMQFIDSAGIGALVQLRGDLQRAAGALVLANPHSPNVQSALTASQLARVIPMWASVEEAWRDLSEKYQIKGPPAPQAATDQSSEVLALLKQIVGQLQSLDERLMRLEQR